MKLITAISLTVLISITKTVSAQSTVYIDIDVNKAGKLISPFIYGRNNSLSTNPNYQITNAELVQIRDAGVKLIRQSGGNNSTKYNWRLKLSSHPDWYNNVYTNDWDFSAKTMLDKLPGVHGIWSFQLLGKVAATNKHNFNDWGYNQSKWWDGVHQNLAGGGQVNTAGGSKAKVEGNSDLYLMDWPADSTVKILDKWFGTKGLAYNKNRIRYWSMDNEPEIWSGTHDDVMKTQIPAEEFMQLYFKVAKAAKAKDPEIKLLGPVPANEWQWYRWGNGISYNGRNWPWLEYFIMRIAEEEKASGVKLLDVLDIHYYPTSSDAATCVQFHRVFYDRNYVYPEANGVKTVNGGWDNNINKEYIFGRCQDWLTKYMGANHGVTLGLTETGINSKDPNVQAVWYASTMGEFMKNGVEIFTPWSWEIGMWEILHLYSRFNKSNYIQAISNNDNLVSAYPTVNETKDSLTIVLVNRSLTSKSIAKLNLTGFQIVNQTLNMHSISNLPANETFFSKTNNAIKKTQINIYEGQISVDLAPLSVNSIVLRSTPTSTDKKIDRKYSQSSIYPNPVSETAILKFNQVFEGNVIADLFDTRGKKIRNLFDDFYVSGISEKEINLELIPEGIYFIKILSSNKNETVKFIKTRSLVSH